MRRGRKRIRGEEGKGKGSGGVGDRSGKGQNGTEEGRKGRNGGGWEGKV